MTDPRLLRLDYLVGCLKNIMGRIIWSAEGHPPNTVMFSAPLAIGSDASDGLMLRGRAASSGPVPWMHLAMTVEKIPVERMWFLPHGTHTNKAPVWAPIETHRIRLPVNVSRRYAWSDNRVYPHDQNQEIARQIDENLMDTADAISYFLRVTNTSGSIPVPKYQATLGL